jgi:general secretion pathway protein B
VSLILEALKKSEAERQVGRAPGLMTPMPAFASRRSRAPLWIALTIILAGSVAMTGWWFSRSTSETPVEIPLVEAEQIESAAAVASTESDSIEAPAPRADESRNASASTRPVSPPPRAAATPTPALRPQATDVDADLPAPRDPEFDSVERESVALTPESLQPSSPAIPTPPTPVIPAPAVNAASIGAAAPAPAATNADDPLGLAVADLPKVDQLSAQERENLPPLKMSMHLFAEDPAARFVLIDGQRYAGGEQIAASLRVVAIRRDGAELEFNGRHFLLPRP